MAMDPELAPVLEALREAPFPDPWTVSLTELRDAVVYELPEQPTAVGAIAEETIAVEGDTISLRIYHPPAADRAPLLVYLHGGGWVVGSLDSYDEFMRRLCVATAAIVVSVGYRLAPEARFPTPLEDCHAAACWAAANAERLGADPAQLFVGGDSAGGHLAAAVCLLARERARPAISGQLLIYPATAMDFDTRSYRDNSEAPLLTRDMMRWFWDQYLSAPEDAQNPLAVPLLGDLAGLPPATIITAGYDPLRDDGAAYAARMEQAGVAVNHRDYPGMIHGFVGMFDVLPQAVAALDFLGDELKRMGRAQ